MSRASLRGEQDELRTRMRAAGMSHDEIAVEFARRYRYRPRAAHRHARGWTQTQAANHINAHAARAGLDPAGAAPMTGPKLSEVENWPLPNNRRRPTPSSSPCSPRSMTPAFTTSSTSTTVNTYPQLICSSSAAPIAPASTFIAICRYLVCLPTAGFRSSRASWLHARRLRRISGCHGRRSGLGHRCSAKPQARR